MTNFEALQLTQIQLQAFKVLPCKLMHEDVVGTGPPLIISDLPNDYSIIRRGFCTKAVRDLNISCAHGLGFINYAQLLGELPKNGIESEEIPLKLAEIKALLTAVFFLDAEKGEVEKTLAIKVMENQTDILPLKTAIHEIGQRHQQLIQQINDLHQSLLTSLSALIKSAS